MKRIYLDNNATTGLDPKVLDAMISELSPIPANPSSVHYFGQEARGRLLKARQLIADYFHSKPNEIIFTSGGSESISMLLKGIFSCSFSGHIITSNIEHSAVYKTVKWLEEKGVKATFLPAGLWGAVRAEDVESAIQNDTRLIILSAANSETGVKCDLNAIGKIALHHQIPFFVDGVALLGKEPFDIPPGVSGIAFSGHKFHGPKGVGLCIVRTHVKLTPLLMGGDQEYSRRSGTEALPNIVGLAKAIELLKTELPQASERMRKLRDRLENGLRDKFKNIVINGQGLRVPNTSNISFPGIEGEELLIQLDMAGIAVSHGSACSSGALEPSRVLLNMGIPKEVARSSIRFSLSRYTTEEEIDSTIDIIFKIAERLKG